MTSSISWQRVYSDYMSMQWTKSETIMGWGSSLFQKYQEHWNHDPVYLFIFSTSIPSFASRKWFTTINTIQCIKNYFKNIILKLHCFVNYNTYLAFNDLREKLTGIALSSHCSRRPTVMVPGEFLGVESSRDGGLLQRRLEPTDGTQRKFFYVD